MEFLGADVVLVARGDGSRRYCGRGGADWPSALRQGPRGLARGPHSFAVGSAGDAPTARRLAFYEQGRYKAGDWNASAAGPDVPRCLLKRLRSFCLLPSRAARRARPVLYAICTRAAWKVGVKPSSSTRRPASCTPPLRPSKTGDLPKRRVANARVSRALDQVTFSDAALALHGEKRDDSNANVLYYSQRECCGRRNDAVIDF